jgi:hypothetical protein
MIHFLKSDNIDLVANDSKAGVQTMIAITLDPELRSKLNGLDERVEVRDENGLIVGHFLPDQLYTHLLYSWAKQEFADEDEHNRAMAEPGGYSTAEAIACVEKLVQDRQGR